MIEQALASTRSILKRANLVDEVARVVATSHKEAEIIVERILNCMVRALQNNDKIEIRGFGSFHTRERGPWIGRNPKTGTRVEVPAKRVPYFKPSKEVRELISRI